MGRRRVAESADFVSCVSCPFCEQVSFDAADHMAYRTHLFEDHKITRNIDKILELSRQSELIKPATPVTSDEDQELVAKVDTKPVENPPVAAVVNPPAKVEEKDSKEVSPKAQSYASVMKEKSKKSVAAKATTSVISDTTIVEEKKEVENIAEVAVETPVQDPSEETLSKKEQKQKKKKEESAEKEIGEKEKSPKAELKSAGKESEKVETAADTEPKQTKQKKKKEKKELDEIDEILKIVEGKDGKKSKKGKKGKEEKGEKLKDTLPVPDSAKSGVVDSAAMKEVDNILDQWFKGGSDNIDEEVPDELPDITEDKPKPVDKKSAKKKEDKKPPPKKAEVVKQKSKPTVVEPMPVVSKPAAKKNKKTVVEETLDPASSNLTELNDILDEWFASGKVEEEDDNQFDNDRFEEITDDNEIADITEVKEESEESNDKEDKTDLDEVNDILDEWFANEGGEEDDNKEVIEDEPVVEETTDYKPTIAEDPIPKSDVPCGDCVICGQLAKAFCTGCKHVFYCTREHQKKDWATHKEVCKEMAKLPYRVERSPVFGRFLAATKDLPEGELILQESPMIVGPRQLTKPVCLGCHKEIKSAGESIKATRAAGARVKVDVFNQTNMMYACITVLRALSLLDGSKKIWDDYTKFDSHLSERIKTPMYTKVNKEKVVFFILHYLNIKRYSDLEILEACGKLDTNCYEIRMDGLNLRAMYRTACLMSHDCTPNTRHTFAPDYSINLYTTRSIKKGDIISATYTTSLWPTAQRQEHLMISKCFRCVCLRCRDPTELGSLISAVRCSRCKGFRDDVQNDDLQYLTPVNPLDPETSWRCGKCTNIQKASQIKTGNESIKQEVANISKNDFNGLLTFLHKNEPILGRNNHHIVSVKYTIVSLLGNRPQYELEDLSMEQLQIKERFCRELLLVADKIEPGSTRWRGQLMLELQMAIVALAAGKAEGGLITKGAAKEAAEEGMQLLKTATAILQVEPDMIQVLEGRMKSMSKLLARWEE